MNKLIKSIALILFVSCSSSQVKIESKISNYPVIIRLAKDDPNRVITIQIPNRIILKNNSYIDKTFLRIYYEYNDSISSIKNGGYGMDLFTSLEKKMSKIKNKKRTLKAKQTLDYLCYSYHYSSEKLSKEFHSYIQKAKEGNRDTIHIMSKNRYKKIFKKLTQKDSISIQFLNNGKLGKRVTVPVKW